MFDLSKWASILPLYGALVVGLFLPYFLIYVLFFRLSCHISHIKIPSFRDSMAIGAGAFVVHLFASPFIGMSLFTVGLMFDSPMVMPAIIAVMIGINISIAAWVYRRTADMTMRQGLIVAAIQLPIPQAVVAYVLLTSMSMP